MGGEVASCFADVGGFSDSEAVEAAVVKRAGVIFVDDALQAFILHLAPHEK